MKFYLRISATTFLVLYSFYYLYSVTEWHFIDNVDLLLHEAGHIIFFPFGSFLYIFGGTLMQLLIPAIFAAYFYEREEHYAASILLYWLGINFFNVAYYASDAIAMKMPLLGGDSSGHDWHNLLSMTSLLGQTKIVSEIIYSFGILCVVSAFFFSLYYSRTQTVKS